MVFENDEVSNEYKVFNSRKESVFGKSNLFFRFLRLGVRAATLLNNHIIILSIGNRIFEYDLETQLLSNGYFCGEGIRPLIFTELKGLKGFDDGIYFGGYLGNRHKRPVSIYKRTGVDKWEMVYTFPQGAINHIHALVADPFRSCVWIYTGDFEDSAAIWKATDNFQNVSVAVCNDQKYRGCVAFALPEGLLYATDAPFAQNNIFLLKPDMELMELKQIDGSCIYGCKWNEKYVFSTTVEPDGINPTKLQALFGRKRGRGIKDNYIHLYQGDLNEGFKEVYKLKKDALPYCSFQFGVFRFPYGENKTDTLYFQPIATKQFDLSLMRLNLND